MQKLMMVAMLGMALGLTACAGSKASGGEAEANPCAATEEAVVAENPCAATEEAAPAENPCAGGEEAAANPCGG